MNSTNGFVDRYKFTIEGTSVNGSTITLNLGGYGEPITVTGNSLSVNLPSLLKNPTNNMVNYQSLNPMMNWTSKSHGSSNPVQAMPHPKDGLGLDWSDAVASGYSVQYNPNTSTINISVGKSFSIDPTTIATLSSGELSPNTTEVFQGQHRLVQISNTLFMFWYDNSNIVYKYSTDDGQTFSSTTYLVGGSTGTGQLASFTQTWSIATTTISGTTYIAVMYWIPAGSNMDFYSQRGAVSGTTITWSGAQLIGYTYANSALCGTGGACASVSAATDTNNNIFAVFSWMSGGATTYSYRVVESKDGGYSWTFLFSQVDGLSSNQPAMVLTRLASGNMLLAYALYESTNIYYRVLNMNNNPPTWTDPPLSNSTSMTVNNIRQISADSDASQNAYVAFHLDGTSRPAYTAEWSNTGVYQTTEEAGASGIYIPAITIVPSGTIHVYGLNGDIVDFRRVNGAWLSPVDPWGTFSGQVNELTAAISFTAVAFTYGGCWPCNIEIAVNPAWDTNSGYQVTTDTNSQNEPSIAVRSTNDQDVVIAANHATTSTGDCRTYQSTDGGKTWNYKADIQKANSTVDEMTDPSLTSDNNGNFYLSCLEAPILPPGTSYIRMVTNNDGGSSWTTVTNVVTSTDALDKPWIVADSSSSSHYKNNVYLCWTDATANNIQFEQVVPSISYHTTLVTAPSGGFVSGCNMAIDPSGNIYVVYEKKLNTLDGSIELRRSTNGGQSWDSTVYTVGSWSHFVTTGCVNPPSIIECIQGYSSNGSTYPIRVEHYPSIATDSNGGIHVTWATYSGSSTLGDILYANAAQCCSFSTPINLNQNLNPNKNATDQWEPAIVFSPTERTVHITAYDRRQDSSNVQYTLYDYYCYTDYGNCQSSGSWFNQQVETPSSTDLDTSNPGFIDDYHGIATSADREVYSAWTDSRNINTNNPHNYDIYTDRTDT